LAAWALSEAAYLGADSSTVDAARRALAFLSASLSRGDADWRTERGPGDLPPIAWATRAYAAARDADSIERGGSPARVTLVQDERPLALARAEVAGWIASDASERSSGRLGAGLLAHALVDPAWREKPGVSAALAWLRDHPPVWSSTGVGVDFAGWYLATAATYEDGGDAYWKSWVDGIKHTVVDHQVLEGEYGLLKGSWDPVGVWGAEGGRVFASAMCGLTLLVHYSSGVAIGIHAEGHRWEPRPFSPPPTEALPERRARWPR
jgi:hypothetical protein